MYRRQYYFILLSSLCLAAMACQSSEPARTSKEELPTSKPSPLNEAPKAKDQGATAPDVLMLGQSNDEFEAQPGALRLLLGSKAGTYYRLGTALARDAKEHGLSVQPLPSFGSVENLYLVALGQADAAFVQLDLLRNGRHELAANAVDVLSPLFLEEVHLVSKRGSKISSLADLKGKRVHLGRHGGGTAFTAGALMKAAGVQVETDCEARYGASSQSLIDLAAGDIDAAWVVAGAPLGAFKDIPPNLVNADQLHLIPLSGPMVDTALKNLPGYQVGEVPAEAYVWLKDTVKTVAVPCVLIVSKKMDAAQRELLMKSMKERKWLPKAHPKGADFADLKLVKRSNQVLLPEYKVPAVARIVGAGDGGTYDTIASGLCRVGKNQSLKLTTLKTNGSFHNLILLASGEAELALVQRDVLQAVADSKTFAPLLKELRLLSPIFSEEVHLLARRDGSVSSVEDLSGKRVQVGLSSSGTWWTVHNILSQKGIQINAQRSTAQPALMRVLGGELDAMFLVGGSPMGLLSDLPATYKEDLKLVPLSALKGYEAAAIDTPSYQWNDSPCKTLSTEAYLIARRELSGDFIVKLIQGMHAHKKSLMTMHPKWSELDLARVGKALSQKCALAPHVALKAALDGSKTGSAPAEDWSMSDSNNSELMPEDSNEKELEGEVK
ncbi:MAG: TAXI family TRAP transporter solute-binding subunit [Planctomycetota bacterium]|nr:TAXI family TRAP transporter solute-binding subunit [Planctomycetota bacterium]